MNGYKTFFYGLAIALTAIFSSADMQAFIAEHIPWIGGFVGAGIIILRAITRSGIFSGPAPKGRFIPVLAAALILPLMLGCGIAKQADTPLKKWAVAQEAQTAASDALVVVIEAGRIDKATAIRIDGWLDQSQSTLDLALGLIRGGDGVSALTLILDATGIINNIMKEIENVTARNTGPVPGSGLAGFGDGRSRVAYYRDTGGGPGARSDARRSVGYPDARRGLRGAAQGSDRRHDGLAQTLRA